MTSNMDEEIAADIRKKKEGASKNIWDGIYINNEWVEFKQQVIYEDKMSIMLPVSFVTMPQKMAKIKYPSESRPQVIKTDLTGSVNMTFNLFEPTIRRGQIEGVCNNFKTMIRNMNPANIFYEQKTEEIRRTVCSYFDYKSYAIDAPIYNIVYLTSIGGRLLHGTFNCRFNDMTQWKPIAMQMKDSIIDLT